MWYEMIEDFYLQGFYTDEQLDSFVAGGMITEEEKQKIIASKTAQSQNKTNK